MIASAAMPPDAGQGTRTAAHWGALFLVFAVALLTSHSRAAELPFSLLALLALPLYLRLGRSFWDYPAGHYLLIFFACYWLPMLTSLSDAVEFPKSASQTLAALRFPLASLSIMALMRYPWQLRLLYWGIAGLVVFWVVDASVQQVIGFDLLGLANNHPRLSGVFAADYLRLGLYSALLLPFLLLQSPLMKFVLLPKHARPAKPPIVLSLIWVVAVLWVLAVVWLSGTRSGWVMAGLALLCWSGFALRRLSQGKSWAAIVLYALFTLSVFSAALTWSYQNVSSVRGRLDQTVQIFSGDEAEIDRALSYRLPIWRQAWAIAIEHPINGVGPRGFRTAYTERAEAGDYFLTNEGIGASHAHQLQLSIITETGLIGLLAFFYAGVLFWRSWHGLNLLSTRSELLPLCSMVAAPALALLLIIFPLNSHLDAYASSAALMFWWLIAIYLTAWRIAMDTLSTDMLAPKLGSAD